MAGVPALAGTRKGAFILTSDGKRERWDISGPHFGGWEIYYILDGGQTWRPVAPVCAARQPLRNSQKVAPYGRAACLVRPYSFCYVPVAQE